ncbi:unnamed protein product, partial [marine sediment metagenome]
YVLGRTDDHSPVRLVHLTGLAAFMLKEMEWRGGSVYGARVILKRLGPKKNGPVEAFLHGWCDDFGKIPMAALEHSVLTLYKLHSVQRKLMMDGKPMPLPKSVDDPGGCNGHANMA